MIDDWLNKFKNNWINKNVEGILDLFAENVEYWETPYKKLLGKELIYNEWQAVHLQHDIELDFSVYSTDKKRHAILWKLSYKDADYKRSEWAGTYLVELDDTMRCTYFYQVGEKHL